MEAKNRRAWIKNVAIIFLTVLLLLTFFSNTILNYSLPEVSAQYAKYDSISGAIKATGTVKANESYVVTYDEADSDSEVTTPGQTRKVISVYVKQGSEVAIGDPILALEGGSSEELEEAEKKLRDLEKEYALAQLQSDSDSISSSSAMLQAQQKLNELKEAQSDAQEMYNLMLAGDDPAGALKTKMDEAAAEMKSIEKNKEAAEKVYSDLKANIDAATGKVEIDYLSGKTLQERYEEAKALYEELNSQYTTLQNQLEILETEQKEHTDNNESVTEAYEISKQIKSDTESLEDKKLALSRLIEDHNIEIAIAYAEQYEDLFHKTEDNVGGDDSTDTDPNALANKEAMSNLERQLRLILGVPDSMTISEILNYVRDIEDRQAEIQKIQASIDEGYQKLNILGMPYIDDITSYIYSNQQSKADKEVQDVKDQIEKIEKKYEEAKTEYTSLSEQISNQNYADENQSLLAIYEKDVDELTEKYEEATAKYNSAKTEYDNLAVPTSIEDALEALTKAKDEVTLQELAVKKLQTDNNKTEVTSQYSLEDQAKEIESLQAKIQAMEEAPDETIVTAPIAGKIVDVNFVPGNKVTSGNTVATIEVADKGYICELTMTTEEARKIQVGAECSITNSWWYSDIEASVTQIRSDPSSQGKNRIVVIEVKGDVYEGQSLTFSIGDKSQSYDSVLPNSAIREDSEGKFVLVVESKNTPLSVRYTARRMSIEVITSDDTKSAVSGLYGSEFVITSATSPISDGQQVRLAEN